MTNTPPASGPPSPALAAIETLSAEECAALLRRHRLCVLSVVDGTEPYAVPLFYGFDGATVHLGLAEGRKTTVLDSNPNLCLTVTEVGEGNAWASVIVAGRAEWVVDPGERERSVQVLMEHNRRLRSAAPGGTPQAPQRRHGGGRILRVGTPVISGRARR